jgi:hypothetical protein
MMLARSQTWQAPCHYQPPTHPLLRWGRGRHAAGGGWQGVLCGGMLLAQALLHSQHHLILLHNNSAPMQT